MRRVLCFCEMLWLVSGYLIKTMVCPCFTMLCSCCCQFHHPSHHINGVGYGAIACIGCKTYFFCSLSIEETLKNI